MPHRRPMWRVVEILDGRLKCSAVKRRERRAPFPERDIHVA